MTRLRTAAATALACCASVAGCGGDEDPAPGETPVPAPLGQRGSDEPAQSGPLGFPDFATKNTTRVGGADPVADAAAVALAVHPSATADTRPAAVTLVDRRDWAAAISAAQLAGASVRAPVLLVDGTRIPTATALALERLRPAGIERIDGAQAIRVGTSVRPAGLRETNVEGEGPAALARAIDELHTRAQGEPGRTVVVAGVDAPAFAMPAAGWSAKSGDPVLWTGRDRVPRDTIAAIRAREQPRIFVLGPPEAVSQRVVARLERLGPVRRISGPDPVRNAIAFARYGDGRFGWGVVDPGHGLVLAAQERTADAAAAAPLSAAGSYGPLLLLDGGRLTAPVRDFLLDIRPGYESDPVRGVYNHAWLMGDATTISAETQSRIDSLLEIQPVDPS